MTRTTHAHNTDLRECIPPAMQELLGTIRAVAADEDMPVYAIGGCIRDWLRGANVTDMDIAVEGNGVIIAKLFAKRSRGEVVVHKQFGTATVQWPAGRKQRRGSATSRSVTHVDFASTRKESYGKPAAYPRVAPGSIMQDVARRDFSINAMAMRLEASRDGTIIDMHHGQDDLQREHIRVLHAASFIDDPSRILRAIRFASRLAFTIEPQTATWMRAALRDGRLSQLNSGRLRKELAAMAAEPEPVACLRHLAAWLSET